MAKMGNMGGGVQTMTPQPTASAPRTGGPAVPGQNSIFGGGRRFSTPGPAAQPQASAQQAGFLQGPLGLRFQEVLSRLQARAPQSQQAPGQPQVSVGGLQELVASMFGNRR